MPSFILDPTTGEPAALTTVKFTPEEARILRLYKKLCETHAITNAAYCKHCFEKNLAHGMEAFVTADKILFRCRCSMRSFDGPTW